jgi:type IV secretion system protein TrbL
LALAFAALLIVVSYTLITINFIVTLVESYLVVSVGFIFLGFGGSRWTAPYTERYIGLAVSIGIKDRPAVLPDLRRIQPEPRLAR